jgi:hypothetical protein
MKEHRIGIIMNGVTGRMGTNQHLMRSIVEIIKQGGVKVGAAETIIPDPVLVGRDANKLEKLCKLSGVTKMTTQLEKRWPTRTTASTSTPRRPAAGPRACARP